MKLHLLFWSWLLMTSGLCAQTDSLALRNIYDEALAEGEAYANLRELCKDIGHRLSGSQNAERAVEWAEAKMRGYGFDRVRLEPVMVPKWVRGEPERCIVLEDSTELDALALGFSVGTDGPLRGEVVMFHTLQALKDVPEGSLEGKIVFLNQAMNAKLINTFSAYVGCSGGRVRGPSIAASKGAVGFVMRSLGLRADDFPHTGVMYYAEGVDSIPAFALSTNSAHRLAERLVDGGKVHLEMEANCRLYPDVLSHNVIADIEGSEHPEKIFVVGGHLDSWDVGEGAHDDGAGVVQAMEVLRIFKSLGIRPRHTIRCVLFMNEENGARGAKAYAEGVAERNEVHLAAMESDRGGYTPRGFSVDAPANIVEYLADWLPLFEPYNIHIVQPGYGGVDINPLKKFGTPLLGFVPDSQRYFDVHHTANDVFERVNERELALGAATMASMVYLIDRHGLPQDIKP